jgi:predicted ATP-grasp superfamily ATP-dependent carboligase
MSVLVTDGDQRSTLAVTRSLGRRGIRVVVGETKRISLASSSKYCSSSLLYPSPYTNSEEFYRGVTDYVKSENIDLIIPITDVTTQILSERKDDLPPHASIVIPDAETWKAVSDKSRLLLLAKQHGIAIPETYFIDSPDAVKQLIHKIRYPVVVKPTCSWLSKDGKWSPTHVHYAQSERELQKLYKEKEYLQYPSMIQERITGPGVGVFVLFNHGELITIFGHRRLREKPPAGGVSCLRESIAVEPDWREQAIRLFKPLRWHGVAMMEYKVDQKTGHLYLMEVNGRFWGSLQLAIDAGVDFPYLLYRLALDGHVETPPPYRVGIKSRWLMGDFDHLLARMFHKDRDLDLPNGVSSRGQTLLQFLKFYEPQLHYEIISASDPRPFIYELSQYIKKLFRKRLSTHA